MFSLPSLCEAKAKAAIGAAPEVLSAMRGGPLMAPSGDGLAARYSALAGDGSAGPRAREAAMLFSAAEQSLMAEDGAGALRQAEEALAIFREVGDSTGVADALRILISAHTVMGNSAEASRIACKELEAFRQQGERRGEAAMLLSEAEVAASLAGTLGIKESDRAIQSAVTARGTFGELGDGKMEASCLHALATAHLRARTKKQQREELARALAAGQEALAFCGRLQDKRGQAKALHAMAVVCSQGDDESLADALAYAREALTIWKDLEDKRAEALELHALAQLQLQDKRTAEAIQSAQDAMALLREERVGRGHEVTVLATLAKALTEKKDMDQAIRVVERKIAHFQADEDTLSEALALHSLFSVYLSQEDMQEAVKTAERALLVLRSIPERSEKSRRLEARVLHSLADAQLAEGQAAKAEQAIEACLRIFKELQDFDGQVQASCTLSYVSMHLNEWRDAIRAASDARDVARQEQDMLQEGVALLALCAAHSGKGDQRRAAAVAKEAQDIFYEEENKRAEANALYLLSNVYIGANEHVKAIAAAKKSQMLYREVGSRVDECNLALMAAHAGFYAALQEGAPEPGTKPLEVWQKALRLAEDALALNRKIGDESQICKCYLAVAQVHVMTKQQKECQEALDEAIVRAQKSASDSAEAYAWTLTAQMYWALKQEDRCPEFASKALTIFKRLGDARGEALAEEMTHLTSEGVVIEPGAAVVEYTGPTEEMLLASVSEVAFSLIGNESLSGDTPLMDAGLDSLASVEFQNTLAKEFTGVQLPSTLVFDFPTPKTISEFIYTGLKDAWKAGK